MKKATFVNFTDREFTAYWNGRKYTFKPGQRMEGLNYAIAAHLGKHLANQHLTLDVKDGEKFCSPKKPAEVPQFMEHFNRAVIVEKDGQEFDADTGLPLTENGDVNTEKERKPVAEQPSSSIDELKPRQVTGDPYDAASNPSNGLTGKPTIIDTADDAESADDDTFQA